MSDPRTTRPRLAIAAVAVVALLGTAALVGSRADNGSRARTARDASAPGQASGSAELTDRTAGAGRSSSSSFDTTATTVVAGAPDVGTKAQGGAADQTGPLGAPVGAKIVRTGTIEVEVARGRFGAATARLTTIATNAGGFVSASQTSALDDVPRGSLTLRVPAARFDAVVGQVGKVGDVQAMNTDSQDVTGEYTDVVSRLRALQAEREQITLVLGRARTIPDILSVRDRLSVVQGEIEQLQGRQKVLDEQASLSTLTVSLHEQGSPDGPRTAPVERTGLSKLWHDAADRFGDGGRSIALGLATMAPWLLLALVLFLPARALWRRSLPAEHRAGGSPASPPAGPPPATATD